MYNHTRALRNCLQQLDVDVYEVAILFVLDDMADENGECYPSQTFLAEICHTSLPIIKRRIKSLKKKGYITIRKRRTVFGNLGNMYRVKDWESAGELE